MDDDRTDSSPGGLLARLRRHVRKTGPWGHLLGFLLRARFQKAGVLLVVDSWTLPTVHNRGGRIEVANNCAFFSGVRLEVRSGGLLRIGSGTYLNRNTEIVAARSVTIGRDCKIARDVLIMDTDQHPLPDGRLVAAPVVIEDWVWIGARAIILKGVRIGHDSVIGAGAIVTRSVPPYSIVVGQAARIIRTHAPDDASPDRPSPGTADPAS